MADEPIPGDITPRRKKTSWTSYLIVGIIAVLVIGGVALFTGDGNGETPANGASPNTNTPVTIPQLKSSIDSLTATVDGFGGRLANLEAQMAGLAAPQVTQADIDSLQASINSLSTRIDVLGNGNGTSTINVSGGSTYWLTGDDDDIRLHILSAKDMRFVAEVTVSYDDPILLSSDATYDVALSDFYDDVGDDRDYIPNLIPYNSVTNNTIVCSNTTINITDWYWEEGTVATEHIVPYTITTCYNTTTTLSDWEYSTVTFHTDSVKVIANVEKSGWIDGLNELGDYDTISVRLLPSLEASETGDEDWF